jgi:hypothetical protein
MWYEKNKYAMQKVNTVRDWESHKSGGATPGPYFRGGASPIFQRIGGEVKFATPRALGPLGLNIRKSVNLRRFAPIIRSGIGP